MSIGAIIMAVLATIVIALAAMLWAILRIINNRQMVKRTLDGQVLLIELLPATMRKSETETLAPEERDVFRTALTELLPPGWATEQSNKALDAIYQYVGDKKQDYPNLEIDLVPALTALRGKEGRRAIGALVDTLPNCPGRTRTPPPAGLFGLPSCVPVGMNRRQVVVQVQRALAKEIEQRLRPAGSNVLGYYELEALIPDKPDSTEPRVLKAFHDLRQSIIQMRRLGWLLPLIAVAALALALLFSQPLDNREITLLLGWPFLVSGITVIVAAILILWRIRRRLGAPDQAPALQAWLSGPLNIWRNYLWIQGGVLAALGLLLVVVGNVLFS